MEAVEVARPFNIIRKRADRGVVAAHKIATLSREPLARPDRDLAEVLEVLVGARQTDVPVVVVVLAGPASPGLVREPEMEAPEFFQP